MKLLSADESRSWCAERGLRLSRAGYLDYPTDEAYSAVISLPKAALEGIGLANVLARELSGAPEGSSLLWLRSWNIWSEDFEEIGAALYKGLLARRGQVELASLPGQLLEGGESPVLKSLLVVPILFQWDAYLVPAHAEHLVFICHDGFVNFLARTEDRLDKLLATLEAWNPTRALPGKIRRAVGR